MRDSSRLRGRGITMWFDHDIGATLDLVCHDFGHGHINRPFTVFSANIGPFELLLWGRSGA
jgi:hypothetical protein